MSIKHVQFALDGVPGLNAGQRLTLVSLGEWANDEGVCWPSHDTIAKRVGVGRRQVIRIIEQLEAMGVIERIERKQYSNKYRVRCDIAMSHPKHPSDVTPVAHVTPMSDVTLGTPDVTSRASRCDIAMSPEPLEPPKNRIAPKARPMPVPDDFEVTEKMYEWAAKNGWSRNQADRDTEQFLDYHRGKGSRQADWTATWRTWMRNTDRFGSVFAAKSGAGARNGIPA
jgi:DNA-binding transcriptional MocR family regulator